MVDSLLDTKNLMLSYNEKLYKILINRINGKYQIILWDQLGKTILFSEFFRASNFIADCIPKENLFPKYVIEQLKIGCEK
jgi:hypothetical protein